MERDYVIVRCMVQGEGRKEGRRKEERTCNMYMYV